MVARRLRTDLLLSFPQELYPDFAILIDQFPQRGIQGEGIVEASDRDRELIAVMRQYFAMKAELESLKEQLEAAREAAGEAIGVFYDPRQNAEHRDGVADAAGRSLG